MALRERDEQGAAAAVVVLFTLALLAAAGLVIDGGYALGAQRRAMNSAEQAARAGADALDEAALRNGTVRVDPTRADQVASAYLDAAGVTGSVTAQGDQVTVTVVIDQDTTLLSAVGVDSIHVEATATATSINETTQP